MPNVEKVVPLPLARQEPAHVRIKPLDAEPPSMTHRSSRSTLPSPAGPAIGKAAREPILHGTLGRNAGLRNLEILLESIPLKLDRE